MITKNSRWAFMDEDSPEPKLFNGMFDHLPSIESHKRHPKVPTGRHHMVPKKRRPSAGALIALREVAERTAPQEEEIVFTEEYDE